MDTKYCLAPGTLLHGKNYGYTIERVLDQGSFGITYQASVVLNGPLGSIGTKVVVAIKEFFMRGINGREGSMVSVGNKEGLFRDYRKGFVREVQNLSKLQHDNIVKILESFEANGTVYYVMEYISGGSLDDLIGSKGLSKNQILNFSMEIGNALRFMHQSNMMHLDLKPANIMIKDGHAVLIDFGLSKIYDENSVSGFDTAFVGGSPGYASIEQTIPNYNRVGLPITMDIYAFGASLFKMATGHRPPVASDIFNDGFPENEVMESPAGFALKDIIKKAMEPMWKNRFRSVDDMLDAINTALTLDENSDSEYNDSNSDITVQLQQLSIPDKWMIIRVWKNNNQGLSKEVAINLDRTNGHLDYVDTYYNGICTCRGEEAFASGLDDETKNFLAQSGLLSPYHWEISDKTIPGNPDFGVDVSIEFQYKDGTSFIRRDRHAYLGHPLLTKINQLLQLPRFEEFVFHGVGDAAVPELRYVHIPDNTKSIEISYNPCTFVGDNRSGFRFCIVQRESMFENFISEINSLQIKRIPRRDKELNTGVCPACITIKCHNIESTSIQLYHDGIDTWGNISFPFNELKAIVDRYNGLYQDSICT